MSGRPGGTRSERPLRVAMIAACPFPYPRGTPIRIHRMAEALATRGNRVTVVTYHLGENADDAAFAVRRIRDLSWYRKVTPGPNLRKLLVVDVLLAREVRRLLREDSFDVIHAHHYEGLLVAAAARGRRDVPIVYDAHTLLSSELPHYSRFVPASVVSAAGRLLDRSAPRLADHTVAVTRSIRDHLVNHRVLLADDASVIGNGIEAEFLRQAAASPPPGGTDRPPTLAFAGNLAPYQGVDLLLSVFRRVRESRPDVRLLLITESDFEPYARHAEDLGVRSAVELVRADFAALPRLLATADVLVNPRPRCDGLPQKLLNYMAAGRPIVSFAGSAPGLAHGDTALLAPEADVDACAALILEVLADPELAAGLGERSRAYAIAECSWEGTATRIEALYRSLIAESEKDETEPARGTAEPTRPAAEGTTVPDADREASTPASPAGPSGP